MRVFKIIIRLVGIGFFLGGIGGLLSSLSGNYGVSPTALVLNIISGIVWIISGYGLVILSEWFIYGVGVMIGIFIIDVFYDLTIPQRTVNVYPLAFLIIFFFIIFSFRKQLLSKKK